MKHRKGERPPGDRDTQLSIYPHINTHPSHPIPFRHIQTNKQKVRADGRTRQSGADLGEVLVGDDDLVGAHLLVQLLIVGERRHLRGQGMEGDGRECGVWGARLLSLSPRSSGDTQASAPMTHSLIADGETDRERDRQRDRQIYRQAGRQRDS